MIYASFSKIVVVRSYEEFLLAMFGSDPGRGISPAERTPAEKRICRSVLGALNFGKPLVVANFNDDVVYCVPSAYERARFLLDREFDLSIKLARARDFA